MFVTNYFLYCCNLIWDLQWRISFLFHNFITKLLAFTFNKPGYIKYYRKNIFDKTIELYKGFEIYLKSKLHQN